MMKKFRVLISIILSFSIIMSVGITGIAAENLQSSQEPELLNLEDIHNKFLRKSEKSSTRTVKEEASIFDYFNPNLKNKGYEVFSDFENAQEAVYELPVQRLSSNARTTSTTAQVESHAELAAALADDSVSVIEVENSFTLTDTLAITRDITIKSLDTATADVTITSATGKRHFTISDETSITVEFDGVILDGNNKTGGGIDIFSSYATIENAHITNCYTANTNGGGAILAYNEEYDETQNARVSTGSLTINGGTFSGNGALKSGGAICSYGALAVTMATIENNTAGLAGGGIIAVNITGTDVIATLSGVTLEDNTAGTKGGGIAVYGLTTTIKKYTDTETSVVTPSRIKNNSAVSGGGISSLSCYTRIEDSYVELNTIHSDNQDPDMLEFGGAGVMATGRLIVLRSYILNNISDFHTGAGAGILMMSPEISGTAYSGTKILTVSSSTLTGNENRYMVNEEVTDAYFYGGAVAAFDINVTITGNSTVSNNKAHYGGAVSVFGKILNIANSTVTGNNGKAYGGAIFASESSDFSTDLDNYTFTSPDVTITSGSTVSSNTSKIMGGAVYICGTPLVLDETTGSYTYESKLQILNGASITGNSSALGGAIGAERTEVILNGTATNVSEIKNNSALGANLADVEMDPVEYSAGAGGGVFVYNSSLSVKKCRIIDNDVTSGSTSKYGLGGGIYGSANAYIRIEDAIAVVAGNTADNGGGIYSANELNISAGTIGGVVDTENTPEDATEPTMLYDGNTASKQGGGIYSSGVVNITDGSISYNTSTDQGGGAYVKNINFLESESGDPTVSFNKAIGAENGTGGGLFISDNGSFVFDSGTIHDNAAYMYDDETGTYIGYGGYDVGTNISYSTHIPDRQRRPWRYIYNNFPEDFLY